MFRRSIVALAMSWAMTGFLPADAAAIPLMTGSAGGGGAQTTIQPFLELNPLIRVQGDFNFVGEVTIFGGNFAPSGWAEANGQLLSISGNTSLFARLGTTYGGDGRTTFALPDLRGRTAIGDGAGPGLTPKTLGQKIGVENVSLPLPAHDHTLPSPPSAVTDTAGGGGSCPRTWCRSCWSLW